jgi:hypothetical protein
MYNAYIRSNALASKILSGCYGYAIQLFYQLLRSRHETENAGTDFRVRKIFNASTLFCSGNHRYASRTVRQNPNMLQEMLE